MKTCRQCGESKPLDSFYRHKKMADGHLNKCKECVKTRVTGHRAENIERFQAYDRRRGQDPKRKAAVKAKYEERISTPEGRAREWENR